MRGEEAERRAAEVQAVAERLALADADVDAALAGRLQDAERDRVVRADDDGQRAASFAAAASAATSSTAPRKFGCWKNTAHVSSSIAAAHASASVTPSRSGTSTTSAPKPCA